MPIEDVDYLKDNSTKQSYVFLVDSTERDRSVHPNPSSYIVQFTQPFTAVIGLEVLDASIPRTMYNIDTYNNTIVFCIHSAIGSPPDSYVTAELEPGDYSIQTLILALNSVLKCDVGGKVMSITADHLSNPPELKNKLVFHCPYPFVFDMQKSTIAESLGFDLFVDPNEMKKPVIYSQHTWKQRRYNILYNANGDLQKKLYQSVNAPVSLAMGAASIVFDGPRSVNRRSMLNIGSAIAQRFTVTSRGYLTTIQAALTTLSGLITGSVDVEIWTDSGMAPYYRVAGPYTLNVEYTDGGYSTLNIQFEVTEQSYWVVFVGRTTDVGLFYNDIKPTEASNTLKTKANVTWTAVDTEDIHFNASVRIIKQDPYNYLVAPGMYSLVGERYVILRCPEIEENSYRSLAYGKHNLGLAKFRLGVVGYSENRVEFSKVPTREFHPIGKLSRLTLYFETSGGKTYDFKGVNHTITFAIHYLEAVQKDKFNQSVLNPNYHGNYMSYIFDDDQNEDSEDNDEYDYNGDEIDEPDYRQHEVRHLPGTIARIDQQALYHIQSS